MAKLQEAAVAQITEICDRHKDDKTPLMMILSDIQNEYGYIPLEVQELVSQKTGISVAEIYGVVTFYSFFSLTPKGKYVVGCCLGTACYVKGAQNVIDKFQELLGVKPGEHYLFMIILSPSGAYYESGLNPVNIYVESKYVRAVRGGMGFAKTGGNYAASLIGQDEAHKQNYSQVLWLDGVEQKYIEEVGAMNIFFVIDGKVVTPMLQGSILPGITRKSAIEVCKSKGLEVEERRIDIQEIADAYDAGKLDEVFGTGTAAVISPVGHLKWGDKVMEINGNKIGKISQMLYDTMTGIQWGKVEDTFNWVYPID